jgi:HEAT repeat protein
MNPSELHPQEIYQKRDEIGLNHSANLLRDILESYKDDSFRKEAIKYLALICVSSKTLIDENFTTIENQLISDDKVEIKCEAAKALGRIKDERGLKPLLWIIEQEDIDNELKLSAFKAIHKIRFQKAEIELFINELTSDYASIRDFVTIQLLSLNPEKLISLLVESLQRRDISNTHKTEIIKLIGYELSSINISVGALSYIQVKYPEIVTVLTQSKSLLLENITLILREEDPKLMESVITILKLMGKEIEEDLTKLLLIDDFIVKKNAITLSGKLKLKNAVDLLVTNLDNIYNEVSIASIEALGEIGDVSVVPELVDILDIEDISFEYTDLDMKLYILDAIKKIYLSNGKSSYDNLLQYLTYDNDTIKESIAFILGELGKEDFVGPLINLLDVRNLDVKKNTIIALGKIGKTEALEELIKILEDNNAYWLIKKVTADAVYNIYQNNWYKAKKNGEETKRKLVMNMAKITDHLGNSHNENFKVKLSLIKILEMYGEKQALGALIKRINDFHRVVRIRASNAIKKIEERIELDQ